MADTFQFDVSKPHSHVYAEGPDGSKHASPAPENPDGWWRSEKADRYLLTEHGSAYDEDFYQCVMNSMRLGKDGAVLRRFRAEKVVFDKVVKQRGGAWGAQDAAAYAKWLQEQTDWWLQWADGVLKRGKNVREAFQKSLECDSGNSPAVTQAAIAELNLRAVLQLDDARAR